MTDKSFQAPETVLMVRPVNFGYNQETADSNTFQQQDLKADPRQIQADALKEFDFFVAKLRKAGVDVIVFDDEVEPHTPDAIFPNNWVSFHQDGKVILYPMNASGRRKERRGEFITALQKEFDFNVDEIIDISYFEKKEQFLEGTGSIVFDYVNKVAYANLSSRTDRTILDHVSTILGYEVFVFEAVDAQDIPIYHTNVVMCVGAQFAVVCLESIPDPDQQQRLVQRLETTGHEVVAITYEQMLQFAGNMMEVKNEDHESILVMSQAAYNSLTERQLNLLSSLATLLPVNINTIEKYGGGSVRCMLAGVFLPKVGVVAEAS